MLLQWLIACDPDDPARKRPGPEPTTEPEPCVATWYADVDGDGFGDPETATVACTAPEGAVRSDTDCDDTDGTVFPGAIATCGGALDQDCDGLPEAMLVDDDGDGTTECDGDCDDLEPAKHPDAGEVCNGVDDDCDGALDLDDADADPWACGSCPALADYATFEYRYRTLNPCLLDPTVSLCLPGEDTHEYGYRLHEVYYRIDDGLPKLRDQLLLFLPPGPGNSNRYLNRWATYAGFRVIVLGWSNEGTVVEVCEDDQDCFEGFRREAVLGEDTDPNRDVPPNDAVTGRFATLLRHLDAEYPREHWGQFLDANDEPRWDNVVVSGWSDGASASALLASERGTAGAFLFSPGLDIVNAHLPEERISDWWFEARPDAANVWAVWSAGEGQADPIDHFSEIFGAWGVPGPAVVVELSAPPYGGSHLLTTHTAVAAEGCTWHGAASSDPCMDTATLFPAYMHAYCTLGTDLSNR